MEFTHTEEQYRRWSARQKRNGYEARHYQDRGQNWSVYRKVLASGRIRFMFVDHEIDFDYKRTGRHRVGPARISDR